MLEAVGPERLAVIANTGDDIEIYGAHVSPDPDLVSFWLAGPIDERGWGLRERHLRGHGRAARASARRSGSTSATATSPGACERASLLADGATPTAALAALNRGDRQPVPRAADERRARAHVGLDAAARLARASRSS